MRLFAILILACSFAACKTGKTTAIRMQGSGDSTTIKGNAIIVSVGTRACTGCKESLFDFIKTDNTMKRLDRVLVYSYMPTSVMQYQMREQAKETLETKRVLFAGTEGTDTLLIGAKHIPFVNSIKSPIVIVVLNGVSHEYSYEYIFNEMDMNLEFIKDIKSKINH